MLNLNKIKPKQLIASYLEENPALWYNDEWGCTGFDLETKYQWHAEDSAGLLKKPRPIIVDTEDHYLGQAA